MGYSLVLRISTICTIFFIICLFGCSEARNPLLEQKVSACEASLCHEATILGKHPPTGGKHAQHLNKDFACENCHNNFIENTLHSNSVLDVDNESIIVAFDDSSSATVWDNEYGNCSYIACHGGAPGPVNWYSSLDSDVPNTECTICHSSGCSIDPLTTCGTGIQGKHSVHVESAGAACVLCHEGARDRSGHMNGIYGKAEEESIVSFDGLFNGMGITSDFNDESGACNNISCHGGTGNVNWYGDSIGCTACHSSGGAIDPMTTNGSGINGKHAAHVTDSGINCDICHNEYKVQPAHMNGIYGRMEIPAIIYFNPVSNPSATWDDHNTTCGNLSCHGSISWYTDDPITCALCHAPDTDIDPEPSGSHSRHLTAGYDCEECHEDYRDKSSHCNGVKENALSAPGMVNFGNSHNPDGTYNPSVLSCSDLYCHGSFPLVNYDGNDINPGNNFSPIWGTGSAGAVCGSCHGDADNNYSSSTHGSHTSNNVVPIIFGNTSKIESCDACHNYGTDTIRTFDSGSTQGSYSTGFHVNFSINDSGANSDIHFKADNADLASKINQTLTGAHTAWDENTASCSDSWCHGNFTDGSDFSGYNASPSWLVPSTGACGTCHENIHDYNNRCGRCHVGMPSASTALYHTDGNISP